jgi:hypothetical protein
MSLVALISILILWIAAGLFGALFFFSSGFRFEPRRAGASAEEAATDEEAA